MVTSSPEQQNHRLILVAMASLLAACAIALLLPSKILFDPIRAIAEQQHIQLIETWSTFSAIIASFRIRLFFLTPILMLVFWRVCLPLIDLRLQRINRWLLVFTLLFIVVAGVYAVWGLPFVLALFSGFQVPDTSGEITWEFAYILDMLMHNLTLLSIPIFIAQHLIAVKYQWISARIHPRQILLTLGLAWLMAYWITPPDLLSTLLVGGLLSAVFLLDWLLVHLMGKGHARSEEPPFPAHFSTLWLLPWCLFWLSGGL